MQLVLFISQHISERQIKDGQISPFVNLFFDLGVFALRCSMIWIPTRSRSRVYQITCYQTVQTRLNIESRSRSSLVRQSSNSVQSSVQCLLLICYFQIQSLDLVQYYYDIDLDSRSRYKLDLFYRSSLVLNYDIDLELSVTYRERQPASSCLQRCPLDFQAISRKPKVKLGCSYF